MKFHIARLSFVPSVQKTLVGPKFEGTPIELAEKLLVEHTRYTSKNREGFTSTSLIFAGFISGTDGRLLSAKLGKAKEVKLLDYDDDKPDFLDTERTSYPYVYLLWDRDEQVILVQKNTSVFQDYEVVLNSIEDHLNNLLAEYELRVFVEPLTEKADFWRTIQMLKYIYEVTFELHMPNFLGETQKHLKEALETFREEYNATGVSTRISNPDGRLNIPESDPQTNTDLEWITKGGGSWSINGKKEGKRTKSTITSTRSQNIKTEETSIELENYTAEEVIAILSVFKPEYSVKNAQGKDDEDK